MRDASTFYFMRSSLAIIFLNLPNKQLMIEYYRIGFWNCTKGRRVLTITVDEDDSLELGINIWKSQVKLSKKDLIRWLSIPRKFGKFEFKQIITVGVYCHQLDEMHHQLYKFHWLIDMIQFFVVTIFNHIWPWWPCRSSTTWDTWLYCPHYIFSLSLTNTFPRIVKPKDIPLKRRNYNQSLL